MTAIAVVNIHPDPEVDGYPVVISDMLLSQKLNGDVEFCQKINLPATGNRCPIYLDEKGEFRRIVMMARKPLILDGNSGILRAEYACMSAKRQRGKEAKYRVLINADKDRQASVRYEDGSLVLRFPADFIQW